MCKCLQSCLETLYWHCFEKHCCYDESIALYSEEEIPKTTSNGSIHTQCTTEKQSEKNNNSHHFDNMSFYDSVAIIAHRAIFTIEPPTKHKTLADNTDVIVQQPRAIIHDSNTPSDDKTTTEFTIPTITEDLLPTSPDISLNRSTDSICFNLKSLGASSNLDVTKSVPCNLNDSILDDDAQQQLRNKHRKQSLHERRVSRSIRLDLLKDHRTEVPIIRQHSIPKFYLDTPTDNQIDSALVRSPSMALSSPVAPNSEFVFDLKSIVQMERERSHNSVGKADGEARRGKELSTHLSAHLGNKLKIIKRHASAMNLQNRSN